jgi:hypothetical protein
VLRAPAINLDEQSNNLFQLLTVPAIIQKFYPPLCRSRTTVSAVRNNLFSVASTKVALTKLPITVGNDRSEWYSAA